MVALSRFGFSPFVVVLAIASAGTSLAVGSFPSNDNSGPDSGSFDASLDHVGCVGACDAGVSDAPAIDARASDSSAPACDDAGGAGCVVVLATGMTSVVGLAVDGTYAYFGSRGPTQGILRVRSQEASRPRCSPRTRSSEAT